MINIAIVVACCGLCSSAPAVDPPPDGGYPNANTAEGTNALFNLTNGFGNTAIGSSALFSNTTGNSNTANGLSALFSNTTGIKDLMIIQPRTFYKSLSISRL